MTEKRHAIGLPSSFRIGQSTGSTRSFASVQWSRPMVVESLCTTIRGGPVRIREDGLPEAKEARKVVLAVDENPRRPGGLDPVPPFRRPVVTDITRLFSYTSSLGTIAPGSMEQPAPGSWRPPWRPPPRPPASVGGSPVLSPAPGAGKARATNQSDPPIGHEDTQGDDDFLKRMEGQPSTMVSE